MTYFRELPDIEYLSPLPHKNSSLDYVRAKNLFRRVKLRDDLQNVFTIFNKYQIPDGARPDTVAEALYGSSEYDWVVLLSAGITRVRDQWPLSDRDVYRFSENKYGVAGLTEIKFYETIEIKDSEGRLILPAGKVVDPNFTFSYSDNGKIYTNNQALIQYNRTASASSNAGTKNISIISTDVSLNVGDKLVNNGVDIPITTVNTSNTITNLVLESSISASISTGSNLIFKRLSVIPNSNPVVGVTNYEYEVRKNNEKRSIYLLKPEYLQQYLNDFRKIMYYEKSSEYVNKKLIRTENVKTKSP